MSTADLPEAAGRRLASSVFSSGLSVADFAATLGSGMRPVGLVQGFCVMAWNPMGWAGGIGGGWRGGVPAGARTSYPCPHRRVMGAEHRGPGFNRDMAAAGDAWELGFTRARQRMVEEATELGADGIVGVWGNAASLLGPSVREFHLLGTAVVDDAHRARSVWSSYAAGAKLARIFDAGLAPVQVVSVHSALMVWRGCVTESMESGLGDPYGMVAPRGPIPQLVDAATDVRRMVRTAAKSHLGSGELHGADLELSGGESAGMLVLTATLSGTQVQRTHEVPPLQPPVPTVRLI